MYCNALPGQIWSTGLINFPSLLTWPALLHLWLETACSFFLGFFQRWSLQTFTVRFLSTFNYVIFTGTITAFRPIIFPHTDVTGAHDSCLHQCSTSWAAQRRGGGGERRGRGGRGYPWLLVGSLLIIKEFSKYS